ncbi:MAG: DUF3262 family protein [Chromatiales bacterium]
MATQNTASQAGSGFTPATLLTGIASVMLVLAFVWVIWVSLGTSITGRSFCSMWSGRYCAPASCSWCWVFIYGSGCWPMSQGFGAFSQY